ncbi:MAG: exodeoxyribonuclease V subunit alpha [Desulfobulbaceae bacterium]|uniref:Exodeoxyribonuclease V subunit alpha n=1 Tax=Candidatus Desulfatifera sulfidica TaxID=2841691 RepID=A0A8J6NBN4_9BACT|nr:exodeoxyribonuclease V subunit alpha [Candidatus Desulfatifera sulfidica]
MIQRSLLFDQQFAGFLTRLSRLSGGEAGRFEFLIAELSAALTAGHSCLMIDASDEKLLSVIPHLVSDTAATPLVLQDRCLYLQRYFCYEQQLAGQLLAMAEQAPVMLDCDEQLDRCFPPEPGEKISDQRRAAELALSRHLALIAGGPGTGKTSTVVKILGLLLALQGTDTAIALAAPTGKAAMRLQESIASQRNDLPFADEICERIPAGVFTLHRLLGVRRHAVSFRYDQNNPLPWDVVVVDESSMIDLALMSKLVDALKPGARLILLGDRDQLSSVESGAVFGDCVAALPASLVELLRTYRFERHIKELSLAVNQGSAEAAWQMLVRYGDDSGILSGLLTGSLYEQIGGRIEPYLRLAGSISPGDGDAMAGLFRQLRSFQVLCAVRHGRSGVAAVNEGVERYLRARGYDCPSGDWYAGRPVMIRRNDYRLELYNGDVGICLPDPDSSAGFRVWFEGQGEQLRSFASARLPEAETVYGMTVHKSQGSEFEEVLLLLPDHDLPVLSRELIYTAITRAKRVIRVSALREIFCTAISRQAVRMSGLRARLGREKAGSFLQQSPEN